MKQIKIVFDYFQQMRMWLLETEKNFWKNLVFKMLKLICILILHDDRPVQ